MSCSAANESMLLPAYALSGPNYINVCTMSNITSNNAAMSLMSNCCGSDHPITTFDDGCFSYCNITGNAAQATWNSCVSGDPASQNLDYACSNGTDLFAQSGVPLPASSGTTYMGGSTGTLVFPLTTADSASASGSAATTTGSGSQATGSASKTTSNGKSSASATGTSSAANASSTDKSGAPTVKQFSKGAVAVLAIVMVGLLV